MAERIVVVRALQLGDMLVAVPALRALRRRFPHAEITLVGLPWAAEFAARFSAYCDRFAAFPGWPGIPEREFDARRARAFVARQRRCHYDLAVQLHGSGNCINPFVLALGAKFVAGYYDDDAPPREFTYAKRYPFAGHEIDRCLGVVALLGADVAERSLEFPLLRVDRAAAEQLLGKARRPRIAIHPGARWRRRRWPAERFVAAANALARRWNATIILTGGAREARLTRAIAACLDAPAIDLGGRTTLGSLGAVLSSVDLVLTNDTGASHLAVAVGTPSVTVWGDAEISRWAPLDAVRHPIVQERAGARDVPSARVVAAASRLLLQEAA